MTILWSRIVAVLLAFIALVILVNRWPDIVGLVKSIDNIRPFATPEEMTSGLVAFALFAVCILAIVRLLAQQQKK